MSDYKTLNSQVEELKKNLKHKKKEINIVESELQAAVEKLESCPYCGVRLEGRKNKEVLLESVRGEKR